MFKKDSSELPSGLPALIKGGVGGGLSDYNNPHLASPFIKGEELATKPTIVTSKGSDRFLRIDQSWTEQ